MWCTWREDEEEEEGQGVGRWRGEKASRRGTSGKALTSVWVVSAVLEMVLLECVSRRPFQSRCSKAQRASAHTL
jgi:hypothetical protein